MRFFKIGPFVAAVLLLALAGRADAQSFKWWQSDQFQKDLGLSADQASRIDGVFEAALPRLRQTKEELDRQEADLSRLIEANAEEAQVAKQVDRVETTRSALNKMRTLMLLHMRQVLSPDQRVKFKVLHDQWLKDHHRDRPSPQTVLQ